MPLRHHPYRATTLSITLLIAVIATTLSSTMVTVMAMDKHKVELFGYMNEYCNYTTTEHIVNTWDTSCDRYWRPSTASFVYGTVNCTARSATTGERSLQLCVFADHDDCSGQVTCTSYPVAENGHACTTDYVIDTQHDTWASMAIRTNCSYPDDPIPEPDDKKDDFLAEYLPYIAAGAGTIVVVVFAILWYYRRKRMTTPAIDYDALLDMETTSHDRHVGTAGGVQDDM